jgi:integrase
MPKQERIKTKYPGVYYIEANGARGKERIFYIFYRLKGKQIEEKAGYQYADDMTAAKANTIRSDRISGKEPSNTAKREANKAIKDCWTIEKLWAEYKANHPNLKGLAQDECRFKKHIAPTLAKKEPPELVPMDLDRIRIKLLKTMKPATVRNVLELLRRILGYAKKKQLCDTPGFKIEMPDVNNLRTEDLTAEQMGNLLRVLKGDGIIIKKDGTRSLIDPDARDAMLLALCSGMRRGEIFKLKWVDVDFDRGFIMIRNPKGGQDQTIPLSKAACEILENRPRVKDSPYVFPCCRRPRDEKTQLQHRVDAAKQFRAIRDAAGLPSDFRPMHGLRHAFASMLASSGQVDMYTLQKLLTHKSPLMTQRYAHLVDETMKNASTLAGNIIDQAAMGKEQNNDVVTVSSD